MRTFWMKHPFAHSLTLLELLALAAFFALRTSRAAMERLAVPMAAARRWLGTISSRTSLSLLEVGTAVLILAAAAYLLFSAVAVCRARRKLQRLYSAVLGAVCAVLAGAVCFCYLWGVNFSIAGFQERSGIYAREVSVEELFRVTAYFVQQLHETQGQVARDENGNFCVSAEDILAQSTSVYRNLEAEFPFLAMEDFRPKAIRFSRLMSRLDFTGMYCPYAGESSVNVDCPTSLLPATVAHELAHQRGFTSELECNFLGILASVRSDDPAYRYSGWLEGYIYLGNALHEADYDAWEAIYSALPATAQADLRQNNAYWDQFRQSQVREVSNKVYDGFLKANGQEAGIRSYGMVVDLLVAYYADRLD